MTLLEWGALGELIGGIAIIGSLIYVGVQVKDSARATRSAATNDASGAMQSWYQEMGSNRQASDVWLNAITSSDPLSTHDEFQFMMMMHVWAGFEWASRECRLKGSGFAAMAKLFGSEALGRAADNSVQIFGGMGLMEDLPIERLWREARIERIWDGTLEIQRHITGPSCAPTKPEGEPYLVSWLRYHLLKVATRCSWSDKRPGRYLLELIPR